MAVALVDDLLPIRLVRVGARQQLARIKTQPHRTAHLVDVSLLGHEVDDGRRGEGRELRGVGVRRIERLAREVDHRALHAQAQAEVRNAVVPRVARRDDLALDASVAKPARHDDACHSHQRRRVAGVELFRRHPMHVDVEPVMAPRMSQRLDDAQVGVGQLDVLAHDRDRHRGSRVLDPLDQPGPRLEIRDVRRLVELEMLGHHLAEAGRFEHQRNLVDRLHVRH